MPEGLTDRYVRDIMWIREELISMDRLCRPVLGIKDWDDAVVLKFGGKKLVASVDGPYNKRMVLKSALIHAATDVVVKGGRPLFAMDSLIGLKPDLKEMIASLKKQAEVMKIPLLGGNTLVEDCEPRCSLTVVGELLLKEPIRDSGARKGDIVCLLGEPIWGEQEERFVKAKKLFETWNSILAGKIKVNASKDVTKGGLVSAVYEMEKKSGRKFRLNDSLPFPVSRNLDNFLLTLSEIEFEKMEKVCRKRACKLEKVGVVS
ncbi:MAG: hypothetical protein FJY77_00425 [Candidatus Altiarchaeales archaeon]|nr:hypothetical protein [Candidatus Altiarchaeales archaeon]